LKPFRIVGITGRDFPDFDPGVPVDFWLPLAAESIVNPHAPSRTDANSLWLYVLARLKPEVTNSRAEAELNAMFISSTTSGPTALFKADDAPRLTLYRAAEGLAWLRTAYAKPLYVLMTAVGLILVVAQVVISILVLVGAGLLGQTVLNLKRVDAGFKIGNLLLFGVDMTASGFAIDDPRCEQLNQELQNRFAALSGVSSASYSAMPMLSGGIFGGEYNALGAPASSSVNADLLPVGPGFFETMKIPLVAGRTFTKADFESSAKPKPIVVNRSFAQTVFGSGDPLGRVLSEDRS